MLFIKFRFDPTFASDFVNSEFFPVDVKCKSNLFADKFKTKKKFKQLFLNFRDNRGS